VFSILNAYIQILVHKVPNIYVEAKYEQTSVIGAKLPRV